MSKSADRPRRVLVTGAQGFLGREVVRQAREAGFQVRATDRGTQWTGGTVEEYCPADILVPHTLGEVMTGMDAVIHCAGLAHIHDRAKAKVAPFTEVNEVGTGNVARAAVSAGVRRLVHISSVSVYGGTASGANEDTPCNPEGAYATSKSAAERRAAQMVTEGNSTAVILRLATLYGEGDPGNVARLIRAIDTGRFVWVGTGSNMKSLLHREDAARACLAALHLESNGTQIYNVSAPPCTMAEVVHTIASVLERTLPRWHIPPALLLPALRVAGVASAGRLSGLQATAEKWLANDYYDTGRFERASGFRAHVSLSEGIRREVTWYQSGRVDVPGRTR
jgi:nucleoside-diphosphate-sugar epimerase